MKPTILFCSAAFGLATWANGARADDTGYTTCNVGNGRAIGYFCVNDGSTSRSGDATIHVYDRDGDEVDSESTIAVSVVVDGCDEIINIPVDHDAAFCSVEF